MNSGLIEFFHGVQVAVMLALMLNIVQFAWWTVKRDKTPKSHCERYLPVYIVLFSTVLVMVQPVSMLVIGSWHEPNFFFDGNDFGKACDTNDFCASGMCMSNAFNCTGPALDGVAGDVRLNGACAQLDADGVQCPPPGTASATGVECTCAMDTNALWPNTTTGWMIQVFCTYLGFIIMFTGVTMATKLHSKIARKWRVLRGAARGRRRRGGNYPQARPVSKRPPAQQDDGCADGS